jgi:DNA-directed RNA polymerase I subunit RPA49
MDISTSESYVSIIVGDALTLVVQTNYELKTELGEAFGTRKAKKAIKAVQENAIARPPRSEGDQAPALGAGELALMASLKETTSKMATKEQLQASVDSAKPVPVANLDATDIQDVYVPETIIGQETFNSIPVRDWQQKAKEGKNFQISSRFVAKRFMRVARHQSAAVQRLRVLRYMSWLISYFKTTKIGKGKARVVAPMAKLKQALDGAPPVIIESMKRKFSDQGTMLKYHVDLLITHCCVFASILDSFDVQTQDLREDLGLEQKQVEQYFREIGARIRYVKAGERRETIATLALPLEFPQVRAPRRRR